MWNFYMQSPWTRDGKVRAEQVSITPQVSGRITTLAVKDNQFVKAGQLLFRIDDTPYHIAILNAEAQLAKAQSDLAKANNEANRRRHLSQNYISAEDLDTANISVKAACRRACNVAEAQLAQAKWQLAQTTVSAPVDGWVTNLSARAGNYATTGQPVFALVDSHSFYVVGYFEETKLRHIREGSPAAKIVLYSGNVTLQGHVSGIGRAIYDQSVETDSGLVPDIKPNVPWVRLAQRVPVRMEFDQLPDGHDAGLRHHLYRLHWRTTMKSPAWLWQNLPWVKATPAQWRYALRNGIAMCLALTVAYYLDLDEPYWAMTSAAVVSFPTVGGVISKSLGRIAGSLLGASAALIIAGQTLNDPWMFLLSMAAAGLPFVPGLAPILPITSPTLFSWRAIPPPLSPSRRSTLPTPPNCGISPRRASVK